MKKFTLEAFEQYKTVKCRPVLQRPAEGTCYTEHPVLWREFEPRRTDYLPAAVPLPQQAAEGFALLTPQLDAPGFAAENPLDLACGFIRRLGAATGGGRLYDGVLMDTGSFGGGSLAALAQAYHDAFDQTALLVPSGNAALLRQMQISGFGFGLLLQADAGILPLRVYLAENNLQRIWQAHPVLLQAKGCPDTGEALLDAARQWHAAASDTPLVPGGRLALRRLTYPIEVPCAGALPLRFWWQVVGNAPIYGATDVRMRLALNGAAIDIPLHDRRPIRPLGDATFNEIIALAEIPPSEYDVQCGIFRPDGAPLPMAIAGAEKDGWYTVGKMVLDRTPRPELATIWQHYYPEGYYPLEDPKLPY